MTLRKSATPQSDLVPRPLSQAVNNPPYPVTPSTEEPAVYSPDLHSSPAFDLQPLHDARTQQDHVSDASSEDGWNHSDDGDDNAAPDELPGTLKVGPSAGSLNKEPPGTNALPTALRPGPGPGVPLRRSDEALAAEPTGASTSSVAATTSSKESASLQTNNPYLRMQTTGYSDFGAESSTQVWADAPSAAEKYGELAELPSMQSPIAPPEDSMAKLALHSHVPSHAGPPPPNQAPLIAVESPTPASADPRPESTMSSPWDPGMDVSSLDAFSRSYGLPTQALDQSPQQHTWQEQQAWEQGERQRGQEQLTAAHETATRAELMRMHEDEFHRGEHEARRAESIDAPPALPPRPASADPRSTPSRADTPSAEQRRSEHYQIKHLRWYDATNACLRQSPALTQNANGPCPLLALVNALVLSTPAGEATALVETLRTREQVSLGLLLDAVFDELMSGRRGGAAQELPDVSELYDFLVTLHTGMNVNPIFVPDSQATEGLSPSSSDHPGGFENTREMRLYKAFRIPLVHGWIPPTDSAAYAGFGRVAKTYESAQLIQFQEEELDAKLADEGLTSEEQRLFEDIQNIKQFLQRWPTQLTDVGLQQMQRALQPGQIAVLFRNDHFSTMYKEPQTSAILTLVTDAGYSTHDEIVWESLVDVDGKGTELYSGDFRPVENARTSQTQGQPVRSMLDVHATAGHGTTGSSSGRSTDAAADSTSSQGQASRSEQEDHDLALALQLQEEEEAQHRRSVEDQRRRNEQQQQQQQQRPQGGHTHSQSLGNPPLIPPRRNNLPRLSSPRPPTSAPASRDDHNAPPPTYAEAAVRPAYHPPAGHPSNPTTPVGGSGGGVGRGMPPGAVSPAPAAPPPGVWDGRRRRRMSAFGRGDGWPQGQHAPQQGVSGMPPGDKGDKCLVM